MISICSWFTMKFSILGLRLTDIFAIVVICARSLEGEKTHPPLPFERGSHRWRAPGADFFGIGIADDFGGAHSRQAEITQRLGSGVAQLVCRLRPNRKCDVVTGSHGNRVVADAHGTFTIEDENRLFIGAMKVVWERGLARRHFIP